MPWLLTTVTGEKADRVLPAVRMLVLRRAGIFHTLVTNLTEQYYDGPGQLARRNGVELAEFGLLLVSWVVAFLLGKELQGGFAQWQETRRSK